MVVEVPVLVVCTNEASELEAWLEAVASLASTTVQPIPCVADNASSDRTPGVIWSAIQAGLLAPDDVVWLQVNAGFAAAQNQLIRRLGSRRGYKWFATLNIDARPDSDWLDQLVKAAQEEGDSHVGMWGGLILCRDREKVSSAGHALREDGAFLDIDWDADPKARLASQEPHFEPFCPCFAAALWAFTLVESVGLPDSSQFLYYDDVELGYKARLFGWRAAYVPSAQAYHPIPNSKATLDHQRELQELGRLRIVTRYLPNAQRHLVLSDLSDGEKELLASLQARDKRPFLSDERRTAVYEEWKNKWL